MVFQRQSPQTTGASASRRFYRVADKDAGLKLETTQGRAKAGGPLVDSETQATVRDASTTRTARHNNRPQTGKDFGK
ncbi:hypothetical protein ABIE18_004279 [Arthrobacter sp. 2762]